MSLKDLWNRKDCSLVKTKTKLNVVFESISSNLPKERSERAGRFNFKNSMFVAPHSNNKPGSSILFKIQMNTNRNPYTQFNNARKQTNDSNDIPHF